MVSWFAQFVDMRRLLLMGVFFAFGGLCFLKAQDEDPASLAKASLVSEVKVAKPGDKVWVALRFEVVPHWHLGWAVAGDAGLPTEAQWEAPDGVAVGELLFPVPIRFEYEGFVSYVHEGTFHLLTTVSIPADWQVGEPVELKAKASWSVCNETNCFPVDQSFLLTLKTGDATILDDNQKADFEKAREHLPQPLPDSIQASVKVDQKNVVLRLKNEGDPNLNLDGVFFFSQDDLVAAAEQQEFSMEEEIYVLRMSRAEFSQPGDRFRGVLFASRGLPEGANAWAIGLRKNEDLLFGQEIEAFSQRTTIDDRNQTPVIEVPTGSSPKDALAPLIWEEWSPDLVLQYQREGKPVYVDFTAKWCLSCQVNKRIYSNEKVLRKMNELGVKTLKADWTDKNPVILKALQSFGRLGVPLNVFYPAGSSGPTEAVVLSEVLTESNMLEALGVDEDSLQSVLDKQAEEKRSPLSLILVYAFLGGLILNLMPCVFPVIGLKIMSFTKLAGEQGSEVKKHGVVFTVGVLLSFWTLTAVFLALRAGGEQVGWGFQMQEPGFVYCMAILLLLFGLSLSGVFEIGLRLTGAGSGLSNRKGFEGTFFSGVLAVVVATPCTAPFLGVAVGAVLSLNSNLQTLLVFTFVGLGLAAPYLFLSFFPQLVRYLPKPGAWMETFKQFMAFPLYATVAWLLWTLSQSAGQGLNSLWPFLGLVGAAIAAWFYGRWCVSHLPRSTRNRNTLIALVVVVLSVWGGWPSA